MDLGRMIGQIDILASLNEIYPKNTFGHCQWSSLFKSNIPDNDQCALSFTGAKFKDGSLQISAPPEINSIFSFSSSLSCGLFYWIKTILSSD